VSSPTVVIDASNLARAKDGLWRFSRIVDIRNQWLLEKPGGHPYAVLDASVRPHLVDQELVRQAETDGWLEVHQGDADDRILQLAANHGAAVISHDKFDYARREHQWLQGNGSRVWQVRREKGRVLLTLRQLRVASDAEIDDDRRKKAEKAGLPVTDPDRRWRCDSPPGTCNHGGTELATGQVHLTGGRWYCRYCEHAVMEVTAEPPVRPVIPLSVTLLHGFAVRWTVPVSEDGLLLGRATRSAPEVHDVTIGLPRGQAAQISRRHLRLSLDDDGELTVEHLAARNATFLNPELDFNGRPRNARLTLGAHYGLIDGDELHLGLGAVRLRMIGYGPTPAEERR
jgi:hypothetical protein